MDKEEIKEKNTEKTQKKVMLLILDGYGISKNNKETDAIHLSDSKYMPYLSKSYKYFEINASGASVGLMKDQIGNSEVGHVTIGAGRRIEQPIRYITYDSLKEFIDRKLEKQKAVHIMGMFSESGVHSHLNHMVWLDEIIENEKYIHIITDGRDSRQREFLKLIKEHPLEVSTISGRAFAMDRDENMDRTEMYYDMLTKGTLSIYKLEDYVKKQYEGVNSDEEIRPQLFDLNARIKKDDIIIFTNFRADRMSQISKLFEENKTFTMTDYQNNLKNNEIIYKTEPLENTLIEFLHKNNKKIALIAESEKEAHVTYFFNGYQKNCIGDKFITKSNKEILPELKIKKNTENIKKCMEKKYDFIVANFANPDVFGHTGNLRNAISAINITDTYIGTVFKECMLNNYLLIITADHGNAEEMELDNEINKKHTNNKVPLIICNNDIKINKEPENLFDIADIIKSYVTE